jgi:hypothetical protein
MAKHGNKAPGFKAQRGSTLIRARGVQVGVVTDGVTVQPIARIHPHNANTRFIIGNRFIKKADV